MDGPLPPAAIDRILLHADPSTFTSLALADRNWRARSCALRLYQLQLARLHHPDATKTDYDSLVRALGTTARERQWPSFQEMARPAPSRPPPESKDSPHSSASSSRPDTALSQHSRSGFVTPMTTPSVNEADTDAAIVEPVAVTPPKQVPDEILSGTPNASTFPPLDPHAAPAAPAASSAPAAAAVLPKTRTPSRRLSQSIASTTARFRSASMGARTPKPVAVVDKPMTLFEDAPAQSTPPRSKKAHRSTMSAVDLPKTPAAAANAPPPSAPSAGMIESLRRRNTDLDAGAAAPSYSGRPMGTAPRAAAGAYRRSFSATNLPLRRLSADSSSQEPASVSSTSLVASIREEEGAGQIYSLAPPLDSAGDNEGGDDYDKSPVSVSVAAATKHEGVVQQAVNASKKMMHAGLADRTFRPAREQAGGGGGGGGAAAAAAAAGADEGEVEQRRQRSRKSGSKGCAVM